MRRKNDEIAQDLRHYERLFDMLKTSSQRDTIAIVQGIRRGLSPEEIVTLVEREDPSPVPHDPQFTRNALLVSLLHSTGSLQGLVKLALDSTAQLKIIEPQAFQKMRNSIVHLPMIQEILCDSSRHISLSRSARLLGSSTFAAARTAQFDPNASINAGETDHPPHHVPAFPWTTITDDDHGVSHLTSLFLSWINPTWLFVEEDLFLRGSFTI